MTPGVYPSIPFAEYLAIPAVSRGQLVEIGEHSPAHLRYRLANPSPPTPAMVQGSALDCLLLDPEGTFGREWEAPEPGTKLWPLATCLKCGAAPGQPCHTKAGDVAQKCCNGRPDLPEEISTGKRRLTVEQWKAVQGMTAAVRTDPYARGMVEQSQHQVTLVWTDEATGLLCKARPDMVRRGAWMADLKSCAAGTAHPERWAKHAWGLSYHYQVAWYLRGWRVLTGEELPWLWLAVESEQPHPVAIHQASVSWTHLGEEKCRRALRRLAECRERDEWPGYPVDESGIHQCSPPAWAVKGIEQSPDVSWLEG